MVRKQVSLSQAIEGYFIAAQARRLSSATLADYGYTFQFFTRFLGEDPSLADITPDDIRAFLNSRDGVSKKTLANYWTGLSALWTWAVEQGLVERHVVSEVRRPKPERREIVPYSEADVRAMLGACERSRPYRRPGKAKCDHARPTALRDRSILLVLVDTGVRASELCEMRIYQVDLRNRRLTVMGKGSKERMVPISARTAQAVWRYLAEWGETRKAEVLFPTKDGLPMNRHGLRRLIKRIGDRAGVHMDTTSRGQHILRLFSILLTALVALLVWAAFPFRPPSEFEPCAAFGSAIQCTGQTTDLHCSPFLDLWHLFDGKERRREFTACSESYPNAWTECAPVLCALFNPMRRTIGGA